VIKDDIAQQREVTTGLTDESRVEVLSGVTAGEDVVVAGQANLSNGAKVSAAKDK
jgi:multidrug efflux pump subunit AcrA (membrane-fusion protein)